MDSDGETYLHYAARRGTVELFEAVKDKYPALLKTLSTREHTPLHMASKIGKEEVVKHLLDKQYYTGEEKGAGGWTCLFHAVQGDQLPVIKVMLADYYECYRYHSSKSIAVTILLRF